MKKEQHGGNIWKLAHTAGCQATDIVDFSVNLRPEGPPPFLLKALHKALKYAAPYPSPHAEEACLAAAHKYGHTPENFVFGNGSNELIHTLTRYFAQQGITQAFVIEPAFSEYALACHHAGLKVHSLWGGVGQQSSSLEKLTQHIQANSLVFLANPSNPSGLFYPKASLQALVQKRSDIFWVIDEAFIEYAGPEEDFSLVPQPQKQKCGTKQPPENCLILRSLTKFHALAGVRLGFLHSHTSHAQALRALLPAWTVNCFALQAALAVLADTSNYAHNTRQETTQRREDLVQLLTKIAGIHVFPSAANYVLFRHEKFPKHMALSLLHKHTLALRDCSNYYGLEDGTWFRAAVRLPYEHEKLYEALCDVLGENVGEI